MAGLGIYSVQTVAFSYGLKGKTPLGVYIKTAQYSRARLLAYIVIS